MFYNKKIVFISALYLLAWGLTADEYKYDFSSSGSPKYIKNATFSARSVGPNGECYGWIGAAYKQQIYRVTAPGGATKSFDMAKYGVNHFYFYVSPVNRQLYVYAGSPGRFLKYDPVNEKFNDLGVGNPNGGYTLGFGASGDGRMYVGIYPAGHLLELDTNTDKIRDLGKVSENPLQKYVLFPCVDKNGIVYCHSGKARNELFSVDPKTGKRKQILLKNLQSDNVTVRLMVGRDGRAYALNGNNAWILDFDGMTSCPFPERGFFSNTDSTYNGAVALHSVDVDGQVLYLEKDDRKYKKAQTSYPGRSGGILSLHFIDGDVLYGGGMTPACIFTLNLKDGKLSELPVTLGGKVQVYDGIRKDDRIFFSSYPEGCIDMFDPKTGKSQEIVKAGIKYGQERVVQFCSGPDGKIYACTIPNKGKLGGGLLEIDPVTLKTEFYGGIEKDQSFSSVTSIPATGELLLASSVGGGSSAVATASEAKLVLWDPKSKSVTWTGAPYVSKYFYISGVAPDGMIYGSSANSDFFVFDPVNRKFIHKGELPIPNASTRWIYMNNGFYIAGAGSLVFLDPKTFKAAVVAKHPSLSFYWTAVIGHGNSIYYGNEGELRKVEITRPSGWIPFL